MDSETNPMVITAMLTLDGPLDRRGLDELVANIVRSERFRQRAVPARLGVGIGHWEEDPRFDPALHVHRIAVPPPADDEALAALVSDLMSAPLDRARPLWQLYVVEGLAGGRTALVARVHHCVGDGVALVRLLLSIAGLDGAREAAGPPSSHGPADASDRATRAVEQARALRKLLLLRADPATPLKGEPSRRKRAAWSRPIPLDALKRSAHALGATVNDVLLASTTAALRRYLLARGGVSHGLDVHAIVPVFLGGFATDMPLGNHFGLVFIALPLGCSRSLGRVRVIKGRMDAIKASPEASVAFAILAAAGVAGAAIERSIVDIFTRKGSLMVTNVPGPPVPLVVAGRALESVVVWAPTAGHLALGVSFLSYAGMIRMGVVSDPAVVADPQAIVEELERDVAALLRPPSESESASTSFA
jgi:hypothetical protein